MPFLEHKILLVGLALTLLSCIPMYCVFARRQLRFETPRRVAIFFAFWTITFSFEFFVFGPYSFVELSHEGNLNIALINYLTDFYGGGRFTSNFGGGHDLFVMLPGMHYFNPEALLADFLPIWAVILFHKTSFVLLGLIGGYLIARRFAPNNRLLCAALGAFFTVSHPYLLNYSTNWGTGFAAIPLAVYACLIRPQNSKYVATAFCAGIILAAADPIHVFPALLVTIIGFLILDHDINIKRSVSIFILFVFLSVLVWHEFIYANATFLDATDRTIHGGAQTAQPLFALFNAPKLFFLVAPIPAALYVFSLLALGLLHNRHFQRAVYAGAWVMLTYIAAKIFPWQAIKLDSVGKLSHYYMFLSLTVLVIPVAARAFQALHEHWGQSSEKHISFKPATALFAAAITILIWTKIENAAQFAWFGGQSSFFGYQNLKNPVWRPAEPFRVVTLFERPSPNIIAGFYDFESFDGQFSLNVKPWADYWQKININHENLQVTGRAGIDWRLWNGETYDIERHLRLDLLAAANVRFLFSALPLSSDQLRLVSGPKDKLPTLRRPEAFPSLLSFLIFRFHKIFNPGDLYIYEIDNVVPRAYAPVAIDFIPKSADEKKFLQHATAAVMQNKAIAFRQDKDILPNTFDAKVTRITAVTDGYNIAMIAPEGGLLVINNFYLPFWQASSNGKPLKLFPINGIHMGTVVPPDTTTVALRYKRPLLRERFTQWLSK